MSTTRCSRQTPHMPNRWRRSFYFHVFKHIHQIAADSFTLKWIVNQAKCLICPPLVSPDGLRWNTLWLRENFTTVFGLTHVMINSPGVSQRFLLTASSVGSSDSTLINISTWFWFGQHSFTCSQFKMAGNLENPNDKRWRTQILMTDELFKATKPQWTKRNSFSQHLRCILSHFNLIETPTMSEIPLDYLPFLINNPGYSWGGIFFFC